MDSACQSWQACSKKPLIMGISQSSQAVYFSVSPAALLIFIFFFLAAQALFSLLYFKPVTPCPVCSSSEKSPSRQIFCSWRLISFLAFFSGFKQTQSLQSCFPATLFDRASRVFQAPDTFPSWCCDTGTWEISDSAEGGRGRSRSCNPMFQERGIKPEN